MIETLVRYYNFSSYWEATEIIKGKHKLLLCRQNNLFAVVLPDEIIGNTPVILSSVVYDSIEEAEAEMYQEVSDFLYTEVNQLDEIQFQTNIDSDDPNDMEKIDNIKNMVRGTVKKINGEA